MPEVIFRGKRFFVNYEGFLQDPGDFCPEWEEYVKEQEGIDKITEEHRTVVRVIREYYEENGLAPMVRVLSNITGINFKHIYQLFPSGPAKGACRMAGLTKPIGCI
jgi:tRNA 2-thiouridine synthesizing protein E